MEPDQPKRPSGASDGASASPTAGPQDLRVMYQAEQKKLIAEMDMTDTIGHGGTKGDAGEQRWIEMFSRYLPARFQVRSGIVLDSAGQVSDQIDVVVYDNHFTPRLLDQGRHAYILAEAVYAVFEVKQKLDKQTMQYTSDKIASVRRLMRTSVPMINSGKRLPARPLFDIVGGILTRSVGWSEGLNGDTFRKLWAEHEVAPIGRVDCGLSLDAGCFDAFPSKQWEQPMDDPRALNVRRADAGLMYFLFRLLCRLNSMGTVPAVDWDAYAAVFDDAPLPDSAAPPG